MASKPSKRPRFKKAPLVEVFCEFFFAGAEGEEWDSYLVPNFFEKVKGDYPNRERLTTVGVEFQFPGRAGGPPDIKRHGPPTPRHRYAAEDGKTLLQLGENLLVVNQLPPYYGWEKFEPRVAKGLKAYVGVWKSSIVSRAAVHYIDKVDIPESDFRLEDYFHLYPNLPAFIETPVTNVAMSYEVAGVAEGDILVVTFRQHPSAKPEGTSFLFQWDYVAPKPMQVKQVEKWLQGAHEFLSRAFQSTFTDRCRQLFEPEEG